MFITIETQAKSERKLNVAPKHSCVLCKNKCVDDKVPRVIFKINPGYEGRITRSITKVLDYIHDFILVEVYRCMPLLGDEHNVPNWDIHIARFAIIFTNMTKKGKTRRQAKSNGTC